MHSCSILFGQFWFNADHIFIFVSQIKYFLAPSKRDSFQGL